MIVFSEIQRCQLPHSTHFFQKAKIGPDRGEEARDGVGGGGDALHERVEERALRHRAAEGRVAAPQEIRVAVRGRDVARPQQLLGGPVARNHKTARAQGRVDDGLGPDALGDARELELDLAFDLLGCNRTRA